MSEILSAAAAAMGLPEALVERSAAARAEETAKSVDEILQAWAGGETIESAPAPEPEESPSTAPETTEDTEEETAPETAPTPVAAAGSETSTTPPKAPRAPTRSPVPSQVTPGQAARLPEVITVPTAGIKERTNFAMPKWLTAVLLIAPLFALFALGGSATGQCGEATELSVDVVTGDIVNCDGSAFTGQAAGGGGGTDFIAMGQDIFLGNAVAGVNCSSCHGPNGQGSATFPALTGVLTTFGSCTDHIEWVTQGSAGFQADGRSTYGDTNKPIGGGMPTFGGQLSDEQIAAVASFERARFGGGDPNAVLADCGLAEAQTGDGTSGAGTGDGTTPTTEGPGAPSTTQSG